MAGSSRSAPARGPSLRPFGGRSITGTGAAAFPAAGSHSARGTTSATGRTAARRRSRTSRCSVAGTTARSTRRATRWIDNPTASCGSGARTGGSCPRCRLPPRYPPIPSRLFGRGTTRRGSASTRERRALVGWASAWTWAGPSMSCIPWRGRRDGPRLGGRRGNGDGRNESDPLIEDLEVALAALREELHVRAENAGIIVGPVVFGDDGDRVDCAHLGKGGYSLPSIVEPDFIEIRRCTADFVLLVEKGTQWNRLSEDKFWRRYNCVLLTGNGQPPRGVRRLARRLHEEYKIPVYVLVDNDPWGYYIYSVVKQG